MSSVNPQCCDTHAVVRFRRNLLSRQIACHQTSRQHQQNRHHYKSHGKLQGTRHFQDDYENHEFRNNSPFLNTSSNCQIGLIQNKDLVSCIGKHPIILTDPYSFTHLLSMQETKKNATHENAAFNISPQTKVSTPQGQD